MLKRSLQQRIQVARGSQPADLLISNARIINVFNGEIEEGNIAICGEYIAGTGDYQKGNEVIDIEGRYVAPGFIDGHVHIESSMLDVGEYARAVVPGGTLGVVTDLHEITNVLGIEGIRYVISASRGLPLDFHFMAPSCVPAAHLETGGAIIAADELAEIMELPGVMGLGEMMNYPGVINGIRGVIDKISLFKSRRIDGHAPGLSGKDLSAYICPGIYSDHECVSLEEAREKLAKGMFIMLREGSSEKNLEDLLPLVTDKTYKRCMLVSDDRNAADILNEGDMNWVVNRAISLGLDPVRAIQMATINPAEYFGLPATGAIASGYYANFSVFSSLASIEPDIVIYRGKLVASNKVPRFTPGPERLERPVNTINVKPFEIEALKLKPKQQLFPVINIVPDQIITRKTLEKPKTEDGLAVADVERDILKICVVERHKATGNITCGLIKGFGLKYGAVASSVAHDSHNIVVVGTNDEDMYAALKEVEAIQGGLVVASNGAVNGRLPLPVAGILSTEPAEKVASQLKSLEQLVYSMGVKLKSPFITLSFMALSVIPEIRITDKGLVDVVKFEIIS